MARIVASRPMRSQAGRRVSASSKSGLLEEPSAKDPKTEAMLHFVQAIVLQRGDVNDEDFSALRQAGFSETEVIEILANVALNIFTNYFNILAHTGMDCPSPLPGGEAAMKKSILGESS
jgi:alkylhydroperoxidase family enzyme